MFSSREEAPVQHQRSHQGAGRPHPQEQRPVSPAAALARSRSPLVLLYSLKRLFPVQGDQVEQGNHPEGLGGLHPQAAEGAAACPGDGGETEEAGERQPLAAAAHSGEAVVAWVWGRGQGGGADTHRLRHDPCLLQELELQSRLHAATAAPLPACNSSSSLDPQALLSPQLPRPFPSSSPSSSSSSLVTPSLGLDALSFVELDEPQRVSTVFSADLMSDVGLTGLHGLGDILMGEARGGAASDPLLSCGASKASSRRSSFSMDEDF